MRRHGLIATRRARDLSPKLVRRYKSLGFVFHWSSCAHMFSDMDAKPHMPQTKSARTTHRAEATDSINPVAGGATECG